MKKTKLQIALSIVGACALAILLIGIWWKTFNWPGADGTLTFALAVICVMNFVSIPALNQRCKDREDNGIRGAKPLRSIEIATLASISVLCIGYIMHLFHVAYNAYIIMLATTAVVMLVIVYSILIGILMKR